MSAKLNVSRLRKELSKRGLDTSGLKPALVARLDEAIAKKEADKARQVQVQIASDDDNTLASGSDAIANNSKIDGTREEKRTRTPDDDAAAAACDRDDDVKPLKFIKVEEVGKMGMSQLRAALSDRGIVATTGAKKAALVDQLTAVLDKDLAKQQQYDGAEIETAVGNGKDMDSNLERGKEVVVKKRERALLDIHLPIHIQKDFHVLDHVQETSLGTFPSF
jgi:poly [ADP-ribose] polymerase